MAGLAGKFALGGLRGMASGSGGGERKDPPVAIHVRDDGSAVVVGKRHLLSFLPSSQKITWSAQYDAPRVSGWAKAAMFAASAFRYSVAAASAASKGGVSMYSWENKSRFDTIGDYSTFAKKCFSAAESTDRYHYVLTMVQEGKQKGAGLVGINLDTGKGDRQILFDEKEPNYAVDELTGRVFNVKKKKELTAFQLD